jgi:hypothetical protein
MGQVAFIGHNHALYATTKVRLKYIEQRSPKVECHYSPSSYNFLPRGTKRGSMKLLLTSEEGFAYPPLMEGLATIIDWFKSNYPKIRL